MDSKILQPSLDESEDYKDVSSYNIFTLFFVSLFSGIILTLYLGVKNAKMLKLGKKQRRMIFYSGMLAFILEFAAIFILCKYKMIGDIIKVVLLSRVISLGLYFFYFNIFKEKYRAMKFFKPNVQTTFVHLFFYPIIGFKLELLMLMFSSF